MQKDRIVTEISSVMLNKNKENGKEVVYVQKQDIVNLFESNIAFPASIYNKVFDKTGNVKILNTC